MDLKRCPICGEYYATTYKRCPFCEEMDNPRKAKQPKRAEDVGRRLSRREYEEELSQPIYDDEAYRPRRSAPTGGRRVSDEEQDAPVPERGRRESPAQDYDEYEDYDDYEEERRPRRRRRRDEDYDDYDDYDDYYDDDDRGSPWFKVVVAILVAIILACILYLGRDMIGNLIHPETEEPDGPSSSMSTDEPSADDDVVIPDDTTDPDTPDVTDPDTPAVPDEPDEPAAPVGLKLSHVDVTLGGGQTFALSATGGSGDVTYTSKNPEIATVSANGTVTGVKKGTVDIVVTKGNEKATCIVRVKSDAAPSGGDATPTTPSEPAQLSVNKADFTLNVGESFKIEVSGASGDIIWNIGNSSVATIDGSGRVKAVGAGTTIVTATVGNQSVKAIVRVR